LKLLDKSVNNLSQRLNKLYPDTSSGSRNDGINYWKGRKIIPLDKWLKITKANTISRRENYNVKEGLQYFPDDYFGWMFPLGGIPEELKEEANKWYCDYIELMEYRRNPRIGRTKCFRCLLSPDAEDSALFIGINKVIARALEEGNTYKNSKKDTGNNNNNHSSPSSTSTGTSIYPCKVLNRYVCPYDNKSAINHNAMSNVDYLFSLYDIAFQVELAFGHAYSMSKSNETIYEADFEADKVKEIHANYYGDPYSFSTEYPVQEKLGKEVKRLSKIPIRNVQDVYNALTNKYTFDKLLQQGLEKEYQQYKAQIVDFFMGVNDKVRIEDLIVYEPIYSSNREKGKCSICNEFANIHCVNCKDNIWLCIDHWKYHRGEYHKLLD
jgi:hypothetical protein